MTDIFHEIFREKHTPCYARHVCFCQFISATDTCNDDLACITMASHDKLGLEAIKSLHSQLDDDANGNVDLSESDDVRIFISL